MEGRRGRCGIAAGGRRPLRCPHQPPITTSHAPTAASLHYACITNKVHPIRASTARHAWAPLPAPMALPHVAGRRIHPHVRSGPPLHPRAASRRGRAAWGAWGHGAGGSDQGVAGHRSHSLPPLQPMGVAPVWHAPIAPVVHHTTPECHQESPLRRGPFLKAWAKPRWQGCIRRKGASEAASAAVRQAVGGGCKSG